MSVRANRITHRAFRAYFLGGSALIALIGVGEDVRAQVPLPEVVVRATKPKPVKPRPVAQRPAPTAPITPAAQLAAKTNAFDQARSDLYTTIGTESDTISHATIDALPGGDNQSLERALLQAPGVSQDSAASGLLHVRNDHANVQYRFNGVMLPDGVTGFGSIFDLGYIGSMSLITGALPAEFGMRTVGLVDLTTRPDVFNNSGIVGVYGGSQGTITPYFQYGGTAGNTCSTSSSPSPSSGTPIVGKSPSADCFPAVQYFFTGRYLQTNEGIENPTSSYSPIHDFSQQEKDFAYISSIIDPTTRLSLIAGTSTSTFQIPNVPGQPVGFAGNPPVSSAFGISSFNSALLNENQYEDTQYAVLALQKSVNGFDGQLSYFTRYNYLHFTPDPIGDLLINGIASNVSRMSYTNGVQGDGSYQLSPAHTLRGGFTVSGEQTAVDNTSLVEPAPGGAAVDAPFPVTDNVSKLGWLAGVYVQDDWKVTGNFTINAGLRFDQMWQYVDANQLSPRINFTYKPFEYTTFHAGYARYFTPPVLVEAAPANIALFNGTTGASTSPGTDPVLPERSHYFDAGVVQNIPFGCSKPAARDCTDLDLGVDAYYKLATDLIDNGVFGQALVLSAFNYAKGTVEGAEFSAKFHSGNFQAYANLATGFEKATDVVSNQYLFDNTVPLADLGGLTLRQYVDSHWIYTDHTQIVTGSAGALYQFCGRPATAAEAFGSGAGGDDTWSWCGTRLSADMIYGSGLRTGDANIGTVPAYAQFNVGVAREFLLPNDPYPMTIRFDVVNLFDTIYLIRGSSAACPSGNSVCGIGVFAPQFGPRRGFFAGLSKKFGEASAAPPAFLPGQVLSPIYKAPPAACNWTGVYVGGNFGGAWSALSAKNFSDTLGSSFNGATNLQAVGGGQIGVNYQFWDRVVVGAEAMFDWLPGGQISPITATDPTGTVSANITNASEHSLATATGRLGYAWDRVLVYAKGGGAWVGNTSPAISVAGVPASFASVGKTDNFGYTAGFGLEWAFAGNWSLRAEYDYVGLPAQSYTVAAATPTFGRDVITVSNRNLSIATAAINYKFGGW
jgi:outer membrane receptor protein involved in Fe transport/opacity protein-like surface antigen